MRRAPVLLAFLLLTALLIAPAARADGPLDFTTVKLGGIDGSGTEPRITVAPDDTRYAITSVARSGADPAVFKSVDEGQTWQRTAGNPVTHGEATIDVDVVAEQTGRILGSELDEAGLNFPSSISDDGGKTWTETKGATELADQDRQWFAVGPVDAKTGKPTVYLLYHNLGSGTANHNMFVAKSTDGGETFGPPVPTTVPGQTAYADLQCADSGGPSSIAVNKAGRIYVVFTTRAGVLNPGLPDFGGCAARPAEFNIVNATRVWVASSDDDSPGSWTQSLAVDDSQSGQVVSMQLAYGALDNQGGVYVAYPESPRQYPDLNGAAVKLRYQKPAADGTLADDKWSPPTTLVPAEDPGGATLVHLVAGDPGNVAVAYYRGVGVAGQDKPVWFTHVVHSRNVLAAQPEIVDQRVSDVPAYKWTASEMMGICGTPGPAQGVENGLACDRSADVWGVALDRQCRLSMTWPTAVDGKGGSTLGLPNHAPGTYVSTQSDAVGLCPSGTPPAAAAFLPANACGDKIAPASHVTGRVIASRRRLRFRGRATDTGCGHRVNTVRVSISRRLAHQRCRFLLGNMRFRAPRSCKRPSYLPATGRGSFSFARKLKLPKGRYVIWTRGIDAAGNVERKARTRNLKRFSVR